MKAWEKLYKAEDLDEAIELSDKITIKSNDGVRITAQVGDYNVETFIEYRSPSYSSCSCPSKYPCKHEAALTFYLKNHPELYLKTPDFEEIINLINPDDLMDFLLNELKTDSDFREKFLKRFSDNTIDRDYYNGKLDKIFKKGEGRDFKYHGFHELDFMEDDLYGFIASDIGNVLSAGEHDFACELMIRIAELLNDEVISSCDSWYNLAEIFMEKVNAISFSIYLDGEKLDELYRNTDHIMSVLY